MSTPQLRYRINLCDDKSVVTAEGEYLGTWDTDESNAFYQFTPDGSDEPLLGHPYRFVLCESIEPWHAAQQSLAEPAANGT